MREDEREDGRSPHQLVWAAVTTGYVFYIHAYYISHVSCMAWILQLQTKVLGCVLSTYWPVQFVTGTATDSKAHNRWETVKMETHTCLLVCLIYLTTPCTYVVSFTVGSLHLYKLNAQHTWHRHEYGNIAHCHVGVQGCQDKYRVLSCCYSMHRTPIRRVLPKKSMERFDSFQMELFAV